MESTMGVCGRHEGVQVISNFVRSWRLNHRGRREAPSCLVHAVSAASRNRRRPLETCHHPPLQKL